MWLVSSFIFLFFWRLAVDMNATEFVIIKVTKDHVEELLRNVVAGSKWLGWWKSLHESEILSRLVTVFNVKPEAVHGLRLQRSYVCGRAGRAH